jgi:hypothetical protein
MDRLQQFLITEGEFSFTHQDRNNMAVLICFQIANLMVSAHSGLAEWWSHITIHNPIVYPLTSTLTTRRNENFSSQNSSREKQLSMIWKVA